MTYAQVHYMKVSQSINTFALFTQSHIPMHICEKRREYKKESDKFVLKMWNFIEKCKFLYFL